MMQFADKLYVGNSTDASFAVVGAMLNVAKDLRGVRGWPEVEYMQVGLVDGPGNPISAYHSAVLALAALMKTGKKVLVCCHDGNSRSVAVVMMYMGLVTGRSWSELVTMIGEKLDCVLIEPHAAHKAAFHLLNWRLLRSLIGE